MMQRYPLKIKRHSARSNGKNKVARINEGFKRIERSINRAMAGMPDGSVYMIDGVEAENRLGIWYEDFRDAIDRLGERGRSIIVFKGDPSKFSGEHALHECAKYIRARVFGKSPDDYDCLHL